VEHCSLVFCNNLDFKLLSEFEKIQNETSARISYITRLDIFSISNSNQSLKQICRYIAIFLFFSYFSSKRQLRPVDRVWKSVNGLRIIKQIGIIDRIAESRLPTFEKGSKAELNM
jgi:hypothetical protein